MWINCRWCHSIDAIEIVLCFTYIAIAIATISHTVYSLFFICCILIYKRIDITIKLYSSGCNNNSSLSHVHSVVERVPHLCTPCFNRNVSTSRIRKRRKINSKRQSNRLKPKRNVAVCILCTFESVA